MSEMIDKHHIVMKIINIIYFGTYPYITKNMF